MLEIINYKSLSRDERINCLQRPSTTNQVSASVQAIIDAVKKDGDKALIDLTREFDGVELDAIQVAEESINQAEVLEETKLAFDLAIQNIKTWHQANKPQDFTHTPVDGLLIQKQYRPIQRVGLYVPGGRNTPLISSLLMQAIPASIAGCPIKILCTPPDRFGNVNKDLLSAARFCGIKTIYKAGGAQAIAAMAYGTETIPKVDKIFGPGNQFVTEAKTLVSIDPEGAAIDMPAGPSEVMVLADDAANANFVAADLLAQAEHGPDSQAILICFSGQFAAEVNKALLKQFENLTRKEIIVKSLSFSKIIVISNREEALSLINNYAPEHLIINCQGASSWVDNITAAGTIFIGPWSAETLGDYVTGSNHTLPTSGYARSYSGLSTTDFLTAFTVQTISKNGLKTLGKSAWTLASLEGLDAHANAVLQRLTCLE